MCFFVLLFSPSLFKLLHLQSKTTHIKTKQKQKHSKEHNKKTHTKNKQTKNNINLPARPLEIFIFRGGSWAGNPVFLFCLCCSLSLFLLFVVSLCFSLVFVMFSPSLFKLLHLQSNKHIQKQQQNRRTTEKHKKEKKSLPAGT